MHFQQFHFSQIKHSEGIIVETKNYAEEQTEQFLKRLDDWYAARLQKHYDTNAQSRIIGPLEAKLGKKNPCLEMVGEKLGQPDYFSSTFRDIEQKVEEMENPESTGIDTRTLGAKGPSFKYLKKMLAFVSTMHQIAGERPASELTDEEVNDAFMMNFKGQLVFSLFCVGYHESAVHYSDFLTSCGMMPEWDFEAYKKMVKYYTEKLPELHEEIFGDLWCAGCVDH